MATPREALRQKRGAEINKMVEFAREHNGNAGDVVQRTTCALQLALVLTLLDISSELHELNKKIRKL